jgi:hypothetical protein
LAAQTRIQPEAGDTSADNQNVGGNNRWHAATSVFLAKLQVSSFKLQAASKCHRISACSLQLAACSLQLAA